jgi:hypothetical protein
MTPLKSNLASAIYIYITFVVVVVDDVPKHETEGRECTGQRHGKC